ncbi:protein suppressor of white apricot [Cydia fagiglandana]|uniref:protein suppressor of white apricot n=1 Tax=Cydia fagiglandana TaxID=1458189 RepID=UPI002FEE3F21
MSIKWTGSVSDSGILRKSEFKEKKEELFVFGYSCKLFRDDEKALHIDQGKHLIPWMGDETLKIDRYDARGALHDVASLEAPPGGFDWRVELTRNEQDVEQLCDEERYRALHTDEDEEEMYKEEELKRLHAAGYGQVGFNYDTPAAAPAPTTPVEVDEPFVPTPSYRALFAPDILLPDSVKQNTIIEKTANFIASQGAQMEILIKAKQGDNPQFRFLDMGAPLRPYYLALVALVKAGKWPEKAPEVVEEKQPETDEYLHPSLASTVIESAPSIPSIHYRPSADCDYTMLVSKMRGEATLDDNYTPELAPGEVAPPGTEPLPPRHRPVISRAPVMYTREHESPPPAPPLPPAPPRAPPTRPVGARSTGLSLMKNYNTDSDSDASDYDSSSSDGKDKPLIITPPEDVQVVIDKMAAYVARNGDEFAEIVRAKNDPRFTFLEPDHIYHPYYTRLMQQKRGGANGTGKEEPKRTTAPVSFSIKKLKEPDPILPKPALPYESSSDEEAEKTEKTEKPESPKSQTPVNQIPQAVVYKMEAQKASQEPPKMPVVERKEDSMQPVLVQPERIIPKPEIPQPRKEKSLTPEKKIEKPRDRDSPVKRDKRKPSKTSKSESRERKGDRSVDKERKRDKESVKKNEVDEVISLEDNDDDLIDLTGDYSDTKMEVEGSASREKQRSRRARAAEFLRRVGVDPAHPAAAAALPACSLASAMVDTLESLRKKKEEEEEKRRRREKRRHRSKYDDDDEKAHRKKRRKYRSSEENEESDIDSSKRKKRKKDKKAKSKKKKKREVEEEVVHELPPNIDLSNTLKVLRTTSPTKELCQNLETQQQRQPSSDEERYRRKKNESSSEDERHRRKKKIDKESSSDEEKEYKRKEESEQKEHRRKKKKKEDREYSEGEWSSDSEEDSASSISRDD